ncbi:MAG: hypothetical protein KGJ84_17970, partial [Elusimicrobia bacterium]|nr:hypothetical protein [Elusimicrobiota bacterium]
MTPAEIIALLPQRRPARFVDEVLEVDAEHIVTKYTWTEEDCAGHFPGNPVVPGVKMLEMSSQTAIVAWGLFKNGGAAAAQDAFFTQVDPAMFKMSVRPGETVVCRATVATDGFMSVESKFSGGPKDGETIFAGKIKGVWVPKDSENLI